MNSTASAAHASPLPGSTRRFIKRPDDKLYEEKVSKIRAQMKEKDVIIGQLADQLNKFKPDGAVLDERSQLQQKLGAIIKQQSVIKQQRQTLQDQIKSLDNIMKKKITDLNLQTSKNNFKNVEEIDRKINQLDSLIDSGALKIVDERKTIKEMSALRKLKKDFGHLELQQKSIDEDKTKIADLKQKLNAIQNKEIQAQFEEISSKLEKINLDNKSIYNKRNEIFTKRNAVRKEKDELYHQLKKTQEEFDQEFTKFKKLLDEERVRRAHEEKFYKLNKAKEDLVKDAELQLQNAKVPAFTEEINNVYNLLQHFDPAFERPQVSIFPTLTSQSSTTTSETTTRVVDKPDDVIIIKKQPFETGGSKSKKNKKSKLQKFTIEPTIIIMLSELGISIPASKEDVESTKKLLFEKLDSFKLKQEEQTKINLANAEANKLKIDEKILKLTKDILGDDAEKELTPADDVKVEA